MEGEGRENMVAGAKERPAMMRGLEGGTTHWLVMGLYTPWSQRGSAARTWLPVSPTCILCLCAHACVCENVCHVITAVRNAVKHSLLRARSSTAQPLAGATAPSERFSSAAATCRHQTPAILPPDILPDSCSPHKQAALQQQQPGTHV